MHVHTHTQRKVFVEKKKKRCHCTPSCIDIVRSGQWPISSNCLGSDLSWVGVAYIIAIIKIKQTHQSVWLSKVWLQDRNINNALILTRFFNRTLLLVLYLISVIMLAQNSLLNHLNDLADTHIIKEKWLNFFPSFWQREISYFEGSKEFNEELEHIEKELQAMVL